jgi:hypothetical protein
VNPVPAAAQAKAIRSLTDDPQKQIAFALYFGIMATAKPERMEEIWAVAEATGGAAQYLRQAEVLLEMFPEFRK